MGMSEFEGLGRFCFGGGAGGEVGRGTTISDLEDDPSFKGG